MDQQNLDKAYLASILQIFDDSLKDDELHEPNSSETENAENGLPRAETSDAVQLKKDFLEFERINAGKPAAWRNVSRRTFKRKMKFFWCIPPVLRYMAAAAIIGGIVFIGIKIFEQQPPALIASNSVVITLDDGTQVTIDCDQMGLVVQEPHANVLKQHGPRIVYNAMAKDAGGQSLAPGSRNTIQTPADGECEVVLSDGSLITLSERTKLEYPTTIPEGTSNITLAEGEAAFEIVKDSYRPLKVDVAGKNITATGTLFNMKADKNEVVITSPAFEGGVKMTKDNTLEVGLKADMKLEYDSATKTYRFVNAANDVTVSGSNNAFTLAVAEMPVAMEEIAHRYDGDIICAMGKMSSLRGKSLFCVQDEMPLPFNQNSSYQNSSYQNSSYQNSSLFNQISYPNGNSYQGNNYQSNNPSLRTLAPGIFR